ncbi:Vacuolar protein 8 [Pelomyxa schiedti]|nr:Vacuolar protein 8 [Pelomyxa schiedti]
MDNIEQIVHEGGIPQLLTTMRSHPKDLGVQRNACGALWRLATNNTENAVQINAGGGVECILLAMRSYLHEPLLQQVACSTLSCMSSDEGVRRSIGEKGAIGIIFSSMKQHPKNQDVIRTAFWALANLSLTRENRSKVVLQENGISYLLSVMGNCLENESVQMNAAATLRNLSIDPEVAVLISQKGGSSNIISSMTSHPKNSDLQEELCHALRNLTTKNTEIQAQVAAQKGITLVLASMKEHIKIPALQLYACGILNNMIGHPQLRLDIMHQNGLGLIMTAMEQHLPRDDVQQQCCFTLWGLLSQSEEARAKISMEGIALIISVMRTHLAVADIQLAALGILKCLASLNEETRLTISQHGGLSSICQAIRRHVKSVELLLQGLICFSILSCDSTITQIIGESCIEVTLAIMRAHTQDAEIQEVSCQTLRCFAICNEAAERIGDEGICCVLSAMRCFPQNPDTQTQALQALCNLASLKGNQARIAHDGGIDLVISAMKAFPENASIQESACWVLKTLSLKENQVQIANEGGVACILLAMKSHQQIVKVQKQACWALCNIACYLGNHELIIQENGLAVLLTSMKSHLQEASVLGPGCMALLRLLHTTDARVKVVTEGAVPFLLAVVKNSSLPSELLLSVCQILHALASVEENIEKIVQDGAIACMLSLLSIQSCNKELQLEVYWILDYISRSDENQLKISEEGGIEALTATMKSFIDDASIQEKCCNVLWSLASHPEVRIKIGQCGAISCIIKAMRLHQNNPEVQKAACVALQTLARDSGNQILIEKEGGSGILSKVDLTQPEEPLTNSSTEQEEPTPVRELFPPNQQQFTREDLEKVRMNAEKYTRKEAEIEIARVRKETAIRISQIKKEANAQLAQAIEEAQKKIGDSANSQIEKIRQQFMEQRQRIQDSANQAIAEAQQNAEAIIERNRQLAQEQLNIATSHGNEELDRLQTAYRQEATKNQLLQISIAVTKLGTFDYGYLVIAETADFPIKQVIGSGTCGSVAKAFPAPHLTRVSHHAKTYGVALKMLYHYQIQPGTNLGGTRSMRPKFECEYSALMQNRHWGVANVLNYWRDWTLPELFGPGHEAIALVDSTTGKHLSGKGKIEVYNRTTYVLQELGSSTLRASMQSNRAQFTPQFVLAAAFQLLATVNYLNSRGCYHMDIKDDNILFLERDGFEGSFLVLCDFGVAVLSDTGILSLSPGEAHPGNIVNRAPEVLHPEPTPDGQHNRFDLRKNDPWAIGCVIWQIVNGSPLFLDSNEILVKPVIVPERIAQHPVGKLLSGLLQKKPANRPSAFLSSMYAGYHAFIKRSPAQPTESSLSQVLELARTEALGQLDGLQGATQQGGATVPISRQSIPAELFLRLAFLEQATPALILEALNCFSRF